MDSKLVQKALELFNNMDVKTQNEALNMLFDRVLENEKVLLSDPEDDDGSLDGFTTCCLCGRPVRFNDNGFECGNCGHSCC